MWVSKNAKICVTPKVNSKICFTPKANPNANRWNIGRVRSPTQISCVGHVHFFLFFVDFIRVGSRFFSGIWALVLFHVKNVLLLVIDLT